jgi:hypothetical protein
VDKSDSSDEDLANINIEEENEEEIIERRRKQREELLKRLCAVSEATSGVVKDRMGGLLG